MEGQSAIFCKEVPFTMELEGTINGKSFKVEGRGTGNGQKGYHKGKWVCTTGKLPMSWAAIAGTLGYGYKCFANFPIGIPNFYQMVMPEGWVQERELSFENDGTLKARHEIFMDSGTIKNIVKLEGVGFNADSPVLNDGLDVFLPSTEMSFPLDDGISSTTFSLFPLKDCKREEYLLTTQRSVHKPRMGQTSVKIPGHHFMRVHIKQERDPKDSTDHVVQEERLEAYDFKLID